MIANTLRLYCSRGRLDGYELPILCSRSHLIPARGTLGVTSRDYFEAELEEHRAVLAASRATLGDAFDRMLAAWVRTIRGGYAHLLR